MHETSLIIHLLRRVEREVQAAGASRATAIRLKVGAFAGVEPILLESAFRDLSTGTLADGALLEIETIPLVASCGDCRHRFEVEAFRFRCPACGSDRTKVVAGEGLMLEDISVASVSRGASP